MGHRYVKVRVLSIIGETTYCSIAGLEFSTSIGGANIATFVANASATNQVAANPIARAFDNDDATYWQSSGTSFTKLLEYNSNKYFSVCTSILNITYDFGAGNSPDIAEVRIMPRIDSGVVNGGTPRDFMVYVSDDNINWKLLAIFTQSEYANSKKSFSVEAYQQKPVVNSVKSLIAKTLDVQNIKCLNRVGFHDIQNEKLIRKITNPYCGGASIVGVTTVLGEPVSRKVTLYDQRCFSLIASTISKSDGSFRFDRLRDGEYTIVGIDITQNQNSVIFAHVEAINQ